MDVKELKTKYTGPNIKNYVKKREATPQWIAETKIMEQLLARYPSRTIVDVPVGTGRFMPLYAKHSNKVIGLDVSPDMLEYARAEAERHNVQSARLEIADIFEMDPANYKADVAVSLRFLNHLQREWVPKALKTLAGVAAEAVIASFMSYEPEKLTDEQRVIRKRQEARKDRPPERQHLYAKADFDRWIGDLGLVVTESRNVTVTPIGNTLDVYVLRHR